MADHEEMKNLSSRICRDYLHGAWKQVTSENIVFKHISGGLSNLLYHISLPEHLAPAMPSITASPTSDPISEKGRTNEPREVLIRVYGQTHGEKALESLITDSVIFTLLSERGLGPKLHGIFPGGRIEQFINARPLLTKELAKAKLSRQIAQKMAIIHTMEVPLHKEPRWLWDTIERWLKICEKRLQGAVQDQAKGLLNVNLRQESQWLKQCVTDLDCPVVFCHNDMQEGNILMCLDENENIGGDMKDDDDAKLVLIDFEYCSYNYRSFDLANHFLEWVYDYTEPAPPFYTERPDNYPTREQRLAFIAAYQEECGTTDDPHRILHEVRVLTLASHLFWSLWAIVNAGTSKIPFGYWEYAVTRLTAYQKAKRDLQQSHAVKRKAED